jgi:hypothetical protein
MEFDRHVLQRTVVLPEHRVLFVPVPKAGCTSVLWRLAALAGIDPGTFADSAMPEPTTALTVHDMSRWPPEHRLATYQPAERDRLLEADGWLRFTLVRDPATRLWSAWQSKLLLREPRFADEFGDAPWFPRIPLEPADLVEDFRRFVQAVGRGEAEDVHWAVQHDLVDGLPLTHVGHVEQLRDTLALLHAHVGAAPAEAPRENRSPLPLPPHGYDRAAAATLHAHYAPDYAAFGYAPAAPAADAAGWEAETAALLPHLRATIDQHARLARLHTVAQRRGRRAEAAEEKLAATAVRQVGNARAPSIANRERDDEFAVRWGWADGTPATGFTGVVRVKDEARSLPWSLPPLLRATSRVVLVDNGSTDGTPELARAIAREHGAADRLDVRHYPFSVARCGAEHLGTAADSVHSLVHFYNWSFAHVRTGYALKWDGDMVLTDDAAGILRDLAWQLEASEAIVKVPRYPLYVAGERRAYLDTALRNCEPWGWPNRPGYSFAKAIDWELPLWSAKVPALTLPDWGCVELKHLDADEFAHWSSTDFDASARTRRKQREWEVFRTLTTGAAPPPGVVAIDAPDERHVVDYVRETWLPARVTPSRAPKAQAQAARSAPRSAV